MTKKQKLIGAAIAVGIVIVGIFLLYHYVLIQNVFDQMYYSRVHSGSPLSMLTDYRAMFRRMPQINKPTRGREQTFFGEELGGSIKERYDDSYLSEDHEIILAFSIPDERDSDREMYIVYEIWSKQNIIQWYEYIYNLDDQILTYHALYPELDEYDEHKNFLFDRVLPDFFAANGAHTRFSMDNLGAYTFVDATVEDTP